MPLYTPPRGGLDLLATATASNVAAVDFVGYFTALYSVYLLTVENALPITLNDSLRLRVSDDSGATWRSTAGDYQEHSLTTASVYSAVETGIRLTGAGIVSNVGTSPGVTSLIHLFTPADAASLKHIQFQTLMSDALGSVTQCVGGAVRKAVPPINGARFMFAAGNIASGTFRVYGVKL